MLQAHKLVWSVVTLDRKRTEVEAFTADEACQVAGVAREKCRKFYPFPLRVLPTEEERAERDRRFRYLRELSGARRKLRRAPKGDCISTPKKKINWSEVARRAAATRAKNKADRENRE